MSTEAHSQAPTPLLQVSNLTIELHTSTHKARVVDNLSFSVDRGETLGIVGESGCGKSMTALSLIGLLPKGIAQVSGGSIGFAGADSKSPIDLATISHRAFNAYRGRRIAMIFQEPMTAMNPVYTIGEQMTEGLRRHMKFTKKQARERSLDYLDLVNIPNPKGKFACYPHHLSGGQLQRVMIAMSIICEPELIIADEPTTALDVTVQGEIIDLLGKIQAEFSSAIILISHDMHIVAEISKSVLVMYAGRCCERGLVADVLHNPTHPYTRGLLECVPDANRNQDRYTYTLPEIPGTVLPLGELGRHGCHFAQRCAFADEDCKRKTPHLEAVEAVEAVISSSAQHQVACWKAGDQKDEISSIQ